MQSPSLLLIREIREIRGRSFPSQTGSFAFAMILLGGVLAPPTPAGTATARRAPAGEAGRTAGRYNPDR
jgi:hypothetical protein